MSQLPYDTTGDISLELLAGQLFSWIKRNILWLLLGAALGAGISFGLNHYKPKEYTSSFIGYSNNFDDLRIREMIASLETMRSEHDVPALAKALQLTENEAADIVSIFAYPNNTLEADLPPYPAREAKTFYFSVGAVVRTPANFPKIEKGILAFIDNQPAVIARLGSMRKTTQNRIVQEKAEIEYLQSLKKDLFTNKGSMQVVDIGAVSAHIVTILEKMEDNQSFLDKLDHEIVVTRPMMVVQKPSSPGKYRALGFGAALGFISMLGLFALMGLMRYSKKHGL